MRGRAALGAGAAQEHKKEYRSWLVIVGLQDVADLNMTILHAGKPGQR